MKITTTSLVLATASLLLSCKTTESTPSSSREAETAGGYEQCRSQTPQSKDQLAPSILSQEQVCLDRDTEPARTLAQRAGQGEINEKGDCAFKPSGITCHFHSGQEFLAETTSPQRQGVGELHCIVPTNVPTRPVVYGAHIRCKAQTEAAVLTPHGGEAQACKSDMMEIFSRCSAWRCCDNGTLTIPIAAQTDEQRATRPDFRSCLDEVLEIDCSLLANMHGHEANAPIQGGVVTPPPFFKPTAH